ncbi:MAG: transglycosylase domain-containing protein [bacterium]
MKKLIKNKRFWKNIIMFCAGIAFLFVALIVLWLSSIRIPDFHSFNDRKIENSTKIYDRTGKILLYDIHQDTKRTDISGDAMSINIKNATVAIEDSEFYTHGGIKISSIVRAVLANFFGGGKTQGGSTITQQLVKNTLLTSEKSYTRKIKEWVLAIKIDNSIPKDKILEYYLNEAPYGGNIYGIEEASKTYFDIDAKDLTLGEAAYLAAIPQSPTTLSPYGKNKDKLDARKNLVLSRMLELGFIKQADYDAAKSEVVTFVPQETTGIKAPHFVFFIKNYLEQKYGKDMIEKGGLKVTTTLDYDLEAKGEQIVKDGAMLNAKNWDGKNASLVAIDPKTGQILTMVGSRDYFDKEIDGNFNVATATRQPGSSFKPFIYATAFNKGFTPSTVLFDLPTEFQTTCDAYGHALPGHNQKDCYMPNDFDGKFRGPMTLRDALAQSINIPAIKLFYLAGMGDSLKTAQDMGITTLGDVSQYGLTLVVGGGEVTLLDITSAYGVFADDGVRNPYTGILKIEDASGKVLEEYTPNSEEVLPKNTALTISDVLSDEKSRIPTFGPHSALLVPGHDVAVKTGTTNNDKDAWTVGYSPSIVVGVWAGNNENTPMKKGGAAVAGPIWNKFITEALKKLPSDNFEKPNLIVDTTAVKPALRGLWQGGDSFFIDKISGKLATANTPKETTEEKVITNVHSILYWVDKNNINGPSPKNPESDPQFKHWEAPIRDWWAQNMGRYGVVTENSRPTATDDVHTDLSKPVISINQPNTSTVYSANQKIILQVSTLGQYPLTKLDVFVNGNYIGTSSTASGFSFSPKDIEDLQPKNELRVVAHDSIYNTGETTIKFKVAQ